MKRSVTFETQCWENDFEQILTGDRLQKTIDNCNYKFAWKQVIINKVYNKKKVQALAEECKKRGIIDAYYFAQDYVDEALKHFTIKKSSFKGGYYYSRCQLVGLYLAKTDYLLHFTTDSYIEKKTSSKWIEEGIAKMESNPQYVCASPCWSIGHSNVTAAQAAEGAKAESQFEDGDWYAGYGFSDNCYLVPTKLFKQQIYNEYNKASDRYPHYAGECFEKRVDSYMQNHSLLRICNKHVWYTHTNFPKKPHVKLLGKFDKAKRNGRAIIKKAANYLNREQATYQEITEYRKTIKLYDVFIFFNELELLEMRLNILAPYVDYFVIVESTKTFTGQPKKLIFEENKKKFAQFQDKIIHYVVDDLPEDDAELEKRLTNKKTSPLDREIITTALTSSNVPKGQSQWLREFYQKESMKKALVDLHENDICFISDVDEIWNPEAIIDYRRDDIFKLRQYVYTYYLNNRSSEPWAGTFVAKYKNIEHASLNHLDTPSKTKYTYIKNGGWHFTNQGGLERIKKKLESYGHQEFNNEAIKSDLEKKMASNTDFIGRKFKLWVDEKDLPPYIRDNKQKYKAFFK